jgi:beta-glucosidase
MTLRPILALAVAALSAARPAPLPAAEPSPFTVPLAAEKPVYLDPAAPLEKRVADLVGRMTLEEKAQALDHKGPDLARFGLCSDKWNQCLNGVKWDRPTTLFPVCIALGATWDPELVHEVAAVLSDEARAIYNGWKRDPEFKGEHKGLIYRAPVINISRNPYWGRIHEVWSEDPFLTGRMAVAYVRGLQGDHPHYLKVAATLKHYAVNNVESSRTSLDAVVPERWLREYWLPHFRDAVVEAKAQSLMASYNAINGTPNNINRWLLTDVLKKEWGHEGFVVSDLGGVRTMVEGHSGKKMTYVDAVAQSVMAGCDFSDREYRENIPAAVREGKLTEERLNDAVSRVMRTRIRLGEFDSQDRLPWHGIAPDVIDSPKHHAVALKAAQESLVLLQNRGGLLPLDRNALQRVAVVGPHADVVTLNNYNGRAKDPVTALQGLRNRAPGIEFTHAVGGEIAPPRGGKNAPAPKTDPQAELQKAVIAAKAAEVALVFVGTHAAVEQEGHDRKTLALPGNQEELVKAVVAANPRTVVVLMSAGPLSVPWAKEHVPAILQAWWPGGEGGNAIADVLFGDASPGGRLPYTFYASDAQVPPQGEYDISKGFTYMYVKGEPLFAFGHGLGYTEFTYGNLRVSPKQVPADGTITVSVDVENAGKRAGDEVVQLYVRDEACRVVRAARELRGFQRIRLAPGEKKTVTMEVPVRKLAFWDETTHAFVVEPGAFEVMVGASSADLRVRDKVEVTAGGRWGP